MTYGYSRTKRSCWDRHAHNYRKRRNLLTLIIFSIILSSLNNLNAQQVTLKEHNAKLPIVLGKLKEQTNYSFFYSKSIGLQNIKVNIDVENESLVSTLEKLFNGLPYIYKIANRTIVIVPKIQNKSIAPRITVSELNPKKDFNKNVIRGRVYDEANHPMDNVLVQDAISGGYGYTSKTGDFVLEGEPRGSLILSKYGYSDTEVPYDCNVYNLVVMKSVTVLLPNVVATSIVPHKDPTKFVDLTNRAYMNLGQVLQGTIPGLSLQTATSVTKKILSVRVVSHDLNGQAFLNMTEEQFLKAYPNNGQEILNALLSGNIPSWLDKNLYSIQTATTMTNTIVPQIRGNNNFTSNTAGMLVVIDGFVRDGFPADYPMANVESIEVVKDPKELLKWGPKAAGGLIIIKSKTARGGKLQFNYSTNMYYQPAPRYNRAKQQLAPVSDYLDYIREADSLYPRAYTGSPFQISPANYILYQHRNGNISDAQFNTSWDSLNSLDNSNQIRLLQQNSFSQNHNFTVLGGDQKYRFTFMGGYTDNKGNEINAYNKMVTLNWNNSFNLLNNKMHIDWLLNYTGTKTRSGANIDPNNLGAEPYQMLLDKTGNYAYDYTDLNPDANQLIMDNGYLNYGKNILQDARVNKSTISNKQFQTRYNLKWNILPELSFFTSVLYKLQNANTDNLYGKESTHVRQLVDQYGNLTSNGVNFYVPYGDILESNKNSNKEWNVRTAISFSKKLGKHSIGVSFGGGAASTSARQPANSTLYGYNSRTKLGSPVYFPTPNPNSSITNFYNLFNGVSTVVPASLVTPISGDTTNSRNVNINGGLAYGFGERFSIKGMYSAVYNPVYGQNTKYSVLTNYSGTISEIILKNSEHSFLQNLAVNVGVTATDMPNLPVQYTNTRIQQLLWNNYTIWVSGVTPTQQNGQKSLNFNQGLTASFADGRYQVSVAYNQQKISNLSRANGTSDSTSNLGYLSASISTLLRKGAFNLTLGMNKSPEGQTQFNGSARYDIGKESYFHSKKISSLFMEFTLQNVSPQQGLSTMMSTNTLDPEGNGFSMATNSSFGVLPPKNKNYEIRGHLGFLDERYTMDLRYYNHTTGGLANSVSAPADATTGLSSQLAYSSITNKGIEFFLKSLIVELPKFSYTITLNGAYNINIANEVPRIGFSLNNNYQSIYRNGYSTSNLWSYKWAGLDNQGNPQIYDNQGNKTSNLDSATLTNSMVYSGVTQAPWTGGFIHELRFGAFFSRITATFNWGYVMRRYIPVPSATANQSILIKDRWQKPGDELHTDVPAFSINGDGTNRAFVAQNSSNSIMSADNIRLQEVMIGWGAKPSQVERFGLKSFTFTIQAQNVALWTRNKLHLDPTTVSSTGLVSLPLPKQIACSVNIGF